MAKASRKQRHQYAVLPVSDRDGRLQVALVTSRETHRWVIPKGWPVKGLTPWDAAAKEAFEEAGLRGRVETDAFAHFRYEKRLSAKASVACEVDVFLLHVEQELEDWPERDQRTRRWMAPSQAALLVQEDGLVEALLRLAQPAAESYPASSHPGAP